MYRCRHLGWLIDVYRLGFRWASLFPAVTRMLLQGRRVLWTRLLSIKGLQELVALTRLIFNLMVWCSIVTVAL